jgi:hypothetical protein
MTEKEKIRKQDFVDNVINDMIHTLNPTKKFIKWNIKVISDIRSILNKYYVEELRLCTDEDFYPYIKDRININKPEIKNVKPDENFNELLNNTISDSLYYV